MNMKYNIISLKVSVILVLLMVGFIGVSAADDSNQKVTTYYALIEPDLEGNAYFQINVQNFNYNNSRILGIALLNSPVENYTTSSENKSYDFHAISPNTIIDIFYGDGTIETINTYSPEFEFLGDSYFDLPVLSQTYYINATDEMKTKNISNFEIKYYDSNIDSDDDYENYPFDSYSFTYDISFLNNTNVMLTVSPVNPNNFYAIDVLLNHSYKNRYGSNFEEPINLVYDGVYKIDFTTKENESIDKININYRRESGLAQVSYYVLVILAILLVLLILIDFLNKLPKELNAIIFGTFLTIHTFASSIGYSHKPSWIDTSTIFDKLFLFDSVLITIYFLIITIKWNK